MAAGEKRRQHNRFLDSHFLPQLFPYKNAVTTMLPTNRRGQTSPPYQNFSQQSEVTSFPCFFLLLSIKQVAEATHTRAFTERSYKAYMLASLQDVHLLQRIRISMANLVSFPSLCTLNLPCKGAPLKRWKAYSDSYSDYANVNYEIIRSLKIMIFQKCSAVTNTLQKPWGTIIWLLVVPVL